MSAAPPVPDAAARARALNPTRSFIVEAPAGSGKTTLLIQRFLTLLTRVPRPEALLAITFTRAAAAEMREKVIGAMQRARAGEPPKHASDEQTLALARQALECDARHGWELLRQPGRLRIQTIDAFNHYLAGRLPVLSRAGAGLAISDRPEELYLRAARRTIGELDRGGELALQLEQVLEHLDNEVDNLEPLLAQMLARRDQWLRHVLPGAGRRGDASLRRSFEEALSGLVRDAIQGAAATVPDGERVELWRLVRGAAGRHPEPNAGLTAISRLAPDVALPATPEALPAWQALGDMLLTHEGSVRRRVTVADGFPPKPAQDKMDFLALLSRLPESPEFIAQLLALRALPPPRYDDVQWRVLLALRGVLLATAAHLSELFASEGVVDHPAVQRAAIQALGSADEPSDLTLELDERLQHVLVDEFQDTSGAQVELLEHLTAGWQAGDGRTLFAVGDPMQSIYGFRATDVGLFLRVKRHGIGTVRLEPLRLSANFRSRPALVEWFNRVFPAVLAPAEDFARGAVPYAAASATREPDDATAVCVRLLLDASPAEEGREAARLIAAERARHRESRIAVLAPARAALGHVAAALDAASIAYQGVKLVPLAERPAVRDLVALTRALLHPADRIAWLACLRAPWCGLELEALWQLTGDRPDATLLELMHDAERLARLAAGARLRLERFRSVADAARAERGRRSLAATVEAAWCALGGPATLDDAAGLADADAFLAKLSTLEHGADLEDPAALESALEDLYAEPAAGAGASMQLMTVHGAKGLEWDFVVLVGLGRGGRGEPRALLNWLEFAREGGDSGLVLAPHRQAAATSEPLEQWLRGLAEQRRELERGRLAYVAATRAKERLALVAHVGASPEGTRPPHVRTLLACLWPALEAIAPASVAAAAPIVAGARLMRLADGWQAPAPRAAIVPLEDPPPPAGPAEFEFEWVGAAARHVGTVVHEELEACGRAGRLATPMPADERRWRRRLLELGVGEADVGRALERVRRALGAMRADARGRWLFDAAQRDAASELELSGIAAGQLIVARIDRTFIDADGVRWIVDFKTSVHEGPDLDAFLDRERARYEAQLEGYAVLLRTREPSRPIRLGLYFPMLGGWREWAARASAPDRRARG